MSTFETRPQIFVHIYKWAIVILSRVRMRLEKISKKIIYSTLILSFCWLILQETTINPIESTNQQEIGTEINEKANLNEPQIGANEREIIQNVSHVWNGSYSLNHFIECDVNQNYYIANPFINVSQGKDDINISKFDRFNNILWSVSWGTNETNQIMGLFVTSNGSRLYLIERHQNITFNGLLLSLLSFNTTSGEYIGGFEFQLNKYDNVNEGLLTKDDRFLYVVGYTRSDIFSETNHTIWKLDLFQSKISWNFTFGSSQYSELLKSIDLTDDEEYIYSIGLQGQNIVTMQVNRTGQLFFYNISYAFINIDPVKILLDESETYFHLFGTKITAGQDLVYLNCDLTGQILNMTTYESGFSLTNETCLRVTKNPWNESFYILGFQRSAASYQTILTEIRSDGTMNWWNSTPYYGGSFTYEISTDFIVTDSNNQIITTGFYNDTSFYLETRIYNLTRPPAAPRLSTTNQLSYEATLELMWNAETRAKNYSIYRSDTYFTAIEDATLIEITTNTYLNDNVLSEDLYYYRILASGEYGNSSLSNCLEMLYTQTNTTYLAPLQLSVSNSQLVELTWTDVPGLTSYYIVRNDSISFNANESILVTKTDETFYQEIVPSGIWYYGIICEYWNGTLMNSSLSNVRKIIVPDLLPTPTLEILEIKPYVDNVTITWNTVPNASEYWLYRTMAPFVDFAHFSPILKTTNTQYVDNPQDDYNYFWTIRAINASGSSALTINVTGFVFSPIEVPVVSPNTAIFTDRTIEFNWTASTKAEIYFIFKSTTNITSLSGMVPYANTTGAIHYFNEPAQLLGNYYYVVVAGKTGLNSSMSNCINISLQDLPEQVQNLNITNGIRINTYSNRVMLPYANLSWDPVANADSYEIYRYINKSESNIVLIANTQETQFIDQPLMDTTTYHYGIIALNSTGKGEISTYYNFTCFFQAENGTISSISQIDRTLNITMNWVLGNYRNSTFQNIYFYKNRLPINETNEAEFDFFRNPGINPIWTSNSKSISQLTITLEPGLWFFVFRTVQNYYVDGKYFTFDVSNISNCVSIDVKANPYAPTLYPSVSPNYNRSVGLNWSVAHLATSYLVYRADQPIDMSNINSIEFIANVSATWYIDTAMEGGYITYYAIVASNQTGNSTPSNSIAVDIRNVPNAPIWNSYTYTTFINQINLTWQDSYNYRNYSIYRTNSSNWNETTALLLGEHINSTFIFDFPAVEQNYFYWVFAHNASGTSRVSFSLELTCWLMAAPILTLVPNAPVTNHTFLLTWNSIPHAENYKIYRGFTPNFEIGESSPYQTFTTSSLNYRETNVPLGKYYFVIIASCTFGTGNQSSVRLVRVEDLPSAPIIANATRGNADAIIICWDLVPNADGYIAYMSLTPITENSSINAMVSSPLLGAAAINYTFYKAGIGNHWFIVVAVNGTGRSVFSNVYSFNNARDSTENVGVTILFVIGSIGIAGLIGFTTWKYWQERRNDPDRIMKKFT